MIFKRFQAVKFGNTMGVYGLDSSGNIWYTWDNGLNWKKIVPPKELANF